MCYDNILYTKDKIKCQWIKFFRKKISIVIQNEWQEMNEESPWKQMQREKSWPRRF